MRVRVHHIINKASIGLTKRVSSHFLGLILISRCIMHNLTGHQSLLCYYYYYCVCSNTAHARVVPLQAHKSHEFSHHTDKSSHHKQQSLTLPPLPFSALLRSCWADIPPLRSPENERATNRHLCCLKSPKSRLSGSSGRRLSEHHSRTKPRT